MEAFVATKACPLRHPHDDRLLCSEYLRLEKESTMAHLNSIITTLMADTPAKQPTKQTSTLQVGKISTGLSPYPNNNKLKDNVQSAKSYPSN